MTDAVLSDGNSAYTPGISVRTSGATKFMHSDFKKTVTSETSSAQATTATRTYDAFGLMVASSGSSASVFGFAGGYGYQEDPDSGLKLLGHRYYDPSTGRFLTRDPAKDGLNWYGYCANNPLKYTDSRGLAFDIDTIDADITQILARSIKDPKGAIDELQTIIDSDGIPLKWVLKLKRLQWQIHLYSALQQTHHFLPQEFKEFFSSRGIDIEDYCSRINTWLHRLIHGNSQWAPWKREFLVDWNSRWRAWIESHPNATKAQIEKFADALLDQMIKENARKS